MEETNEYFETKKDKKSIIEKLDDLVTESAKKIEDANIVISVNKTEVPPGQETIKVEKTSYSRYAETDIIQLKNICQVYEEKESLGFTNFYKKREVKRNVIFDNFNLNIKDVKDGGQYVVIVGASGCGKSTLLRYVAGLQKPTSGEIILNGNLQTNKDRVGMVFQQYSSLPWLTVFDNIALSLDLKKAGSKEVNDKVDKMIDLVGLRGHEHKYAQYPILSGGQLQRVAVARSLVAGGEMLLLDEATSGLDVQTKLEMQDLLCDIWTKICIDRDATFLHVCHDLSEAVYLADTIVVLNANPGRVVEQIVIDLPQDRNKLLKRDPKFNEYVYYLEDLMMKINKK